MIVNAIARRVHPPSSRVRPVEPQWQRLLLALAAEDGGVTSRSSPASVAATGPEADFGVFFRRNQHIIFGYLWRITGEEQAAYDLCQETFIRAWQHFTDLRHYEQPTGWLFRVATNLALKHLRHRRVVTRLVTTTIPDEDGLAEPGNWHPPILPTTPSR